MVKTYYEVTFGGNGNVILNGVPQMEPVRDIWMITDEIVGELMNISKEYKFISIFSQTCFGGHFKTKQEARDYLDTMVKEDMLHSLKEKEMDLEKLIYEKI